MFDRLRSLIGLRDELSDDDQEKIALFNQIKLFENCARDDLVKLARASSYKLFEKNEKVIEKGQEGQGIYIIERGRLDVQLTDDESESSVASIDAHDIVGEMSLIDDQPRSANVYAQRESQLLFLPKESFFDLIRNSPVTGCRILIVLSRILSRRLRQTNQQVTDNDDQSKN